MTSRGAGSKQIRREEQGKERRGDWARECGAGRGGRQL